MLSKIGRRDSNLPFDIQTPKEQKISILAALFGTI